MTESAMKLFSILITALLLESGFAEAADRVRLSISAIDVAFLTAGVASKRGFFKDESLDTERSKAHG